MPGYDQTGPAGAGPMSGGGRGGCGASERGAGQGFGRRRNPSGRCGRGMGAGRGMGMGRGRKAGTFSAGENLPQNTNAPEEVEMLKAESKRINISLDDIRKRMEEMERSGRRNPEASS